MGIAFMDAVSKTSVWGQWEKGTRALQQGYEGSATRLKGQCNKAMRPLQQGYGGRVPRL